MTQRKKPPSITVSMVDIVYHWAMASFGFWVALVALGGPFGFIPAQASIIAEMRSVRGVKTPPRESFGRVFGGARQRWRQALPASLLFLVGLVAVIGFAQLGFDVVLTVILFLWLGVVAGHWAFRLSLDRAPLGGGLMLFAYGAWLYLLMTIVWIVGAMSFPNGLPLIIAALPGAAGFVAAKFEGPIVTAMQAIDARASRD